MSVKTGDRVKETTTSTGTGNLTLAGTVVGFITFLTKFGAGITAGISVCIHDPNTGDWEVSKCSYNGGTLVLTRSTVEFSSNANALVNFAAGTKNVFTTISATDIEAAASVSGPAGSNKQVQFNDSSVLGADAGMTFDKAIKQLLIAQGTAPGADAGVKVTSTWNNGATDFKGLVVEVTNTASGSGARLIELLTDATIRFSVSTSGIARMSGLRMPTSGTAYVQAQIDAWNMADIFAFAWANTTDAVGTKDIGFMRSASGLLEINDGVTPGTYRDVILQYLTANNLRLRGYSSSAAGPSTTELPLDKDFGIHKDTGSGNVWLAYNDGGAIKKVQLT